MTDRQYSRMLTPHEASLRMFMGALPAWSALPIRRNICRCRRCRRPRRWCGRSARAPGLLDVQLESGTNGLGKAPPVEPGRGHRVGEPVPVDIARLQDDVGRQVSASRCSGCEFAAAGILSPIKVTFSQTRPNSHYENIKSIPLARTLIGVDEGIGIL